jgi:Icc-related predicted phosphoesterase
MNIHVVSDLHNEFEVFEPEVSGADVVVLAGDIDVGTRGIEWAARTFKVPVVYVAGNHEFYRDVWHKLPPRLAAAAAATAQVRLLDDSATVINGVRFIGSTLWTDFELFGQERLERAMDASLDIMVDYRVIKVEDESGVRRLGPRDTIERHHVSRAALERLLAEPFNGATVVVTHHLPHWGSVHERWRSVLSSAAFASDLDELIKRYQPALWIHGHTHDSADYRVGATRVVCNPRGYVRDGVRENPDFIADLNIKL